jgi:hypothetical protein
MAFCGGHEQTRIAMCFMELNNDEASSRCARGWKRFATAAEPEKDRRRGGNEYVMRKLIGSAHAIS